MHWKRKLAAALFMFGLVLGWLAPSVAEAHSSTIVFTELYADGPKLQVTLRFDTLTAFEVPGVSDANGDHLLSNDELKEALSPSILTYIEQGLTVENNGKQLPLHLDSGTMPNPNVVKLLLSFTSQEPIDRLAIHYDLFFEKAPSHNNICAIQLPGGDTQQFILNASNKDWSYSLSGPSPGTWTTVTQFVELGIHHILSGYDHLLFLFALLLVVTKWQRVLLLVSSFTVAHSITLILAATGVVTPVSKWIESMIALTIIYVAVENVIGSRFIRYRWLLTFAFGLIHGFGFAGALTNVGLPKHQEITALITFNIGVELGQLAVVVCLTPLLLYVRKQTWSEFSQRFASLTIGAMGLFWFITRLF